MVEVYTCQFYKPLPENLYKNYLNKLPLELQLKNSKFVRWEDRHANLFGKLLILCGLGASTGCDLLNSLEFNKNDRPSLKNSIVDFNITHSGEYVICAFGENTKLGIDIEKIEKIDLSNFQRVMTPLQWDYIYKSPLQYHEFFKYWTIKESVIKGDGRGLSIPLDQLEVIDNFVSYENKKWWIKELLIDTNYSAHLATNKECDLTIHKIDFYNEHGKRN